MEITVGILGYASILLIGIGLIFILVDLRTGFDRIFRYFGISLVLISSMAAIDLYTGGGSVPVWRKLAGQRILHEIACVFFPFSGTYLMLIGGIRIPWAKWTLIGAGLFFAPLVPTGLMLRVIDGTVKGGSLYLPLFFPYAVFYILFSYYVLTRNLLRSRPDGRRFALIHLLAFVVLTLSGLLDMVGIVDPSWKMFVSYKIFGILIFGAMSSYVFTERFFLLLQERQEIFHRMEVLRKKMDLADPLREIGESTARISHEIKNCLATMKSNGHLIRMKSGNESSIEADRIVRSTERLESFTRSILAYSSAAGNFIPAEIDPVTVLEACVGDFFQARETSIRIACQRPVAVLGEKGKLEQVYLNLLRNSFEAGANTVWVRLCGERGICTIEMEDDGRGCAGPELESLGKPFYTTKKGQGGTGLGIAISRVIVETFGGSLRFRARQGPQGQSGMIAVIELPLAAGGRKDPPEGPVTADARSRAGAENE